MPGTVLDKQSSVVSALRGGGLGEGMEPQTDSGPEGRASSQVGREGFLEAKHRSWLSGRHG